MTPRLDHQPPRVMSGLLASARGCWNRGPAGPPGAAAGQTRDAGADRARPCARLSGPGGAASSPTAAGTWTRGHRRLARLLGGGHGGGRGAIGAVDAVLTGGMDASFALVRPPGHHAPPDRAMGFCILNHAAIAAAHAVSEYGLSRVLLVDFDVHHGNGTQDCFYGSPQVLYFSTHQSPAYPFTGAVERDGGGRGGGLHRQCPPAAGCRRGGLPPSL